jgi:hypothetical protein
MPSFASVSELEAHLQRTLEGDQYAAAEQALELATGLIQDHTGQELFPGSSTDVFVSPHNFSVLGGVLVLKQRPVTDVTSVLVDDVPATFTFDPRSGIVHVTRDGTLTQTLPDHPRQVTVVYDHGYDPIPATLKAVCLEVARQVFDNPKGFVQMSVGDVSGSYGSHSDAGVGLAISERHRRQLARL